MNLSVSFNFFIFFFFFLCLQFSSHSKDGDVYHTYCLNYTNALTYLERLRRNDDFNEFEKVWTRNRKCNSMSILVNVNTIIKVIGIFTEFV